MTRINLIPDKIYQSIFHKSQDIHPNWLVNVTNERLNKVGMGDVYDSSVFPDIPIPPIDKPLPEWIESNAWSVYGKYHDWNEQLSRLTPQQDFIQETDYIPEFDQRLLKRGGWFTCSEDKLWHPIPARDLPKVLLFDFEAKQLKRFNNKPKNYYPFICGAIDLQGNWYMWLAPNFNELPEIVDFGDNFEYGVGQNIVGYDRRYIKQCYAFDSKVRMFDTLAMYNLLMGMASNSQRTQYLIYKKHNKKGTWADYTCEGSLDAMYEHFTGEPMSKDTREQMKKMSIGEIKQNIADIWKYCAKDVLATLTVFKHLWQLWGEHCPHIATLAGQIERSTQRIGVVPDYYERLAKIDKQILTIKTKRNVEILEWLEKSKDYEHLKDFANNWIEQEYNKRITKSKALAKFDSESEEYREALKRFKKKSYSDFIKALWTKSKPNKLAVNPAEYIPITSKAVVYALQLHWENEPLTYDSKNGWHIIKDGEIVRLPHPKNNEDALPTPLSKDFKSKAVTGEFSSKIADIKQVYETIGIISTWQSYRDRLYDAYIVDNIWLTDNIPCGTVTERMTGTGVVLPNTNEHKAGTELKHFFVVADDDCILESGDYASQENLIFAGIADKKHGYIGCTPLSVQVLSGDDAHNRTGNIILGMLTPNQTTELECVYGSPLLAKLRTLWKNINYANQFLCGVNKEASQIYLAVQGLLSKDTCTNIAQNFINESRGILDYGVYKNGFASEAYNGCKENMNYDVQKSFIYKRFAATTLQKRNVGRDFGTTRFNFNIQQTGQEMLNTCLIVVRILSKILNISYHVSLIIHDEIKFTVPRQHAKTFAWMFQIGHFFSKCLFYKSLNINQVPITGAFLETIEIDKVWRKSIKDSGITPSNPIPTPFGAALKAEQCTPLINLKKFESLPTYTRQVVKPTTSLDRLDFGNGQLLNIADLLC